MSQIIERIISFFDAGGPRETNRAHLVALCLVNSHWVSRLRPISTRHPGVSLAILMKFGTQKARNTPLEVY